MTDVFSAVSDATRRGILERLTSEGPLSLTALAEPLPMSRQAVRKHLEVLEEAGLVRASRRGRERLHGARVDRLRELNDWLEPFAAAWERRLERLKDYLGEEGEMRAIERTIELPAPPERVWRAITDPAELARWFPDRAELDLRPGGEGAWEWDGHGRFPVRVEEVQEPRRFVWSWTHPEGTGLRAGVWTRVEWTLSPDGRGGTVLRVRESGFETDDSAAENLRGWSEELAELVSLLEGER